MATVNISSAIATPAASPVPVSSTTLMAGVHPAATSSVGGAPGATDAGHNNSNQNVRIANPSARNDVNDRKDNVEKDNVPLII